VSGPAPAGLNVPAEFERPATIGERPHALVVDAFAIAAFKLLVSALVLARGFRAVSDDDYARVVIAQRFAEAPALDPSGTSWLPLPFWLYGSAFFVAGPDLGVARGVALALGAVSAVLVLIAARWLGASRVGALAAGVVAAALPHSAWLGAATVPETLSASLTALGVAGFTSDDQKRRLAGAAALGAACWCRYEAWSVTVAVALFAILSAARKRDIARLLPAGVALAPMGLWVAHGLVRHGDALFFWKRVSAYKHALGGEPALDRAFGPLVALVQKEPHLCFALAAAFVALRVRGLPQPLPRVGVLLASAIALLASLVIGEATGGAPTHHPERALLPLWYLAAAALGAAFGALTEGAAQLLRSPVTHVAALLVAASLLRAADPTGFVDRSHAVDIGTRARELGAPALRIDTPDFAYLAVTAAFGNPQRATPFDDRDPRHPRPPNVFESTESLRQSLAETPGAFLVATRAHERTARALGRVRAENPQFILVEPHER
jgi:hypothetical protein